MTLYVIQISTVHYHDLIPGKDGFSINKTALGPMGFGAGYFGNHAPQGSDPMRALVNRCPGMA